jgi:hypothetical protein
MAVSRRLRYEILRRDNHQCRYCGATAPDVPLTVDHVKPVALGGSDDPTNLVTACKDCNAGKSSATPDHTLVDDVRTDAELWEKAKAAAAEGRKATMYVGFEDEISLFDETWRAWTMLDSDGNNTGEHIPRDPDWKVSLRVWLLRGIPLQRLIDLIPIPMKRQGLAHVDRWRYMCGCAWRAITEYEEEVAEAYAEMSAAAERERHHTDERADRAERITNAGMLVSAIERRLGPTEIREIDRITRRALDLILPHVATPDGTQARSDEVLVADLRAGAGLCDVEPGQDFALALADWFFDDAGIDPYRFTEGVH